MATLDDFRKGLKLEVDGRPYVVTEFQRRKRPASVRAKLRELGSGEVIEKTFAADGKIELADVEERSMAYICPEGDGFVFMDAATGEQLMVDSAVVGDAAKYLTDGSQVDVTLYKERPLAISISSMVELVIAETGPPTQGDGTKPATLETGAEIKVPLFVATGDKVKVDTHEGLYIARVR
ncbi:MULTISPECIES: elongation factor P [Streptomyces]|uniref:Elongation factor P n=1 Tax=Streptomyces eurythermus TaxID=42237 RepID=A0ABW6ZAL4_9ACTN|nr:elongation factor P [Streptomyces sp. DSM 40868]QIS75552.1 elongation factor P [Streptomyces sp. DSM 40868]